MLILGSDGSLRMADGSASIEAGEAVSAGAIAAAAGLVLVPEADTRVQTIISRLEELKRLGLVVTMGGVTDPTDRGN